MTDVGTRAGVPAPRLVAPVSSYGDGAWLPGRRPRAYGQRMLDRRGAGQVAADSLDQLAQQEERHVVALRSAVDRARDPRAARRLVRVATLAAVRAKAVRAQARRFRARAAQ